MRETALITFRSCAWTASSPRARAAHAREAWSFQAHV